MALYSHSANSFDEVTIVLRGVPFEWYEVFPSDVPSDVLELPTKKEAQRFIRSLARSYREDGYRVHFLDQTSTPEEA